MAYIFGTGLLTLIPSATVPNPVTVAVLKDVSVDTSYDIKELMGQYQVALAVAKGKLKITAKAKSGTVSGALLNAHLAGSTIAPGSLVGIQGEAGTVAAGTYQTQVANHAAWDTDYGVIDTDTGTYMTRVDTVTTTGQYSVASGVYQFDAGDVGKHVKIFYSYTSPSIGTTVTLTNQLMGTGTPFQLVLFNSYAGNSQGIKFYAAHSAKLSMALKSDDFMEEDIDFEIFADANGNVVSLYTE